MRCGKLSAPKKNTMPALKKQKKVSSSHSPVGRGQQLIDMNEIIPGLHQGSKPPQGKILRRLGVRALVLAAEEYQPPASRFPGLRVFHAPLDDHRRPLSKAEWNRILGAAKFAARNVLDGRRTLVTCAAGLNRSGIISAGTVSFLTGLSGSDAVELVQSRRDWALCNESFAWQVARMFP